MNKITPIILSGGIGARLWPLSTKNLPKHPAKYRISGLRYKLCLISSRLDIYYFKYPVRKCMKRRIFIAKNGTKFISGRILKSGQTLNIWLINWSNIEYPTLDNWWDGHLFGYCTSHLIRYCF